MGTRPAEVDALIGLGEAFLMAGRLADAQAHYTAALDLSQRANWTCGQSRAHDGLGQLYHASGDSREARRHWREALTRYTELGAPEADLIRARLAVGSHSSSVPDGDRDVSVGSPAALSELRRFPEVKVLR
jgi:tetratricopeptide (TPR) repeat protein